MPPGPPPKHPRLRRRRNRSSTAATLTAAPARRVTLPDRRPDTGNRWHAQTLAWWESVWASPMVSEYLDSDVPGLVRLAVLIDEYWRKPSASLAAEIRLQEARFGLAPLDRWRLQWGVRPAESPTPERPLRAERVPDPRHALRVVK